MEEILNSLSTYGYIILFLYSIGGGFVALAAAGVMAYAGKMDLELSILIALAANFTGDSILFYMGRYNKKEVHNYLKKHRRKLAFSHLLIKRHGSKVILFQKFVYGIKTLIPIAIGLTKYDLKRFTVYNLGSSIIWAVVVGYAGFYGGDAVMRIAGYSSGHPYLPPLIMVIVLGLIWFYLSRVTRKA